MTRGRILVLSAFVALAAFTLTAIVTIAVRQRTARQPSQAVAPPAVQTPGRKIKARLYYVSMDGTKLTGVDREVAYADGASAQAQAIVSAQLESVAEPLVSAIPHGTTLRALYLNEKGEAYVDLSREASSAHTGGTRDELLTIYAIVNALTSNLPAVTSVQLLVDGKEVDTLAGHIDLRKPLEKNLELVE
jgi:spore germination protein GerM